MDNPVGFSGDLRAYFLWCSFVGVKYMKYFETAEQAFKFISDNPNKCIDVDRPISLEDKTIWLKELEEESLDSDDEYKIFQPILIAASIPFFAFLIVLLLSRFQRLLVYIGIEGVWGGEIFVTVVGGFEAAVKFFGNFTLVGSILFIALKLIEVIIYRKLIFKKDANTT